MDTPWVLMGAMEARTDSAHRKQPSVTPRLWFSLPFWHCRDTKRLLMSESPYHRPCKILCWSDQSEMLTFMLLQLTGTSYLGTVLCIWRVALSQREAHFLPCDWAAYQIFRRGFVALMNQGRYTLFNVPHGCSHPMTPSQTADVAINSDAFLVVKRKIIILVCGRMEMCVKVNHWSQDHKPLPGVWHTSNLK